jgi:hypothetical protein
MTPKLIKAQIDDEIRAIIKNKLRRYNTDDIIGAVERGLLSPLKIIVNEIFAGLLLVKADIEYSGELTLVVVHAINTGRSDYSISAFIPYLWDIAKKDKVTLANGEEKTFTFIRHHADTKGLIRLCNMYYSDIQEIIFIKRLTPKNEVKNGQSREFLGINDIKSATKL